MSYQMNTAEEVSKMFLESDSDDNDDENNDIAYDLTAATKMNH